MSPCHDREWGCDCRQLPAWGSRDILLSSRVSGCCLKGTSLGVRRQGSQAVTSTPLPGFPVQLSSKTRYYISSEMSLRNVSFLTQWTASLRLLLVLLFGGFDVAPISRGDSWLIPCPHAVAGRQGKNLFGKSKLLEKY